MKNGHPVMDADIHVMEPADLYQKFMDPKWGDPRRLYGMAYRC